MVIARTFTKVRGNFIFPQMPYKNTGKRYKERTSVNKHSEEYNKNEKVNNKT
jgi:hypothetical protein